MCPSMSGSFWAYLVSPILLCFLPVFFIPNELSQCHQTISGVIVNSAKTIIIIFISDNKSNMNNLNLDILEKNINRNTYY